ncbi:MAG: alpha-1,2-fucosyltransferase [Candidatus Pacebacteria bacterium]|nr:alpha-1,2-fucosyltransferase [Candidatus Paceibacterota bacterium]
MIITKLQGGLGNQMFQYAIGRVLAEKNKAELKLDTSWFDNIKGNTAPRKYGLGIFNILENIATNKEIENLKKYKKKNNWKYFFHNLFFANNSIYISEKPKYFNKKALENNNKDIYLDGYWQNEKYFKDMENIILKEFRIRETYQVENKTLLNDIINSNSVSIHIRRNDYVQNKKTNEVHGVCTIGYYQKAIQKISKNNDDIHIFVFSDDILWTQNNLKSNFPITFVDKNKDYEDLILMSMCKHNIIANSSFSWWGAWLNQNPNKIVIAPKKWFNNLKNNKQNPIPQTWIQI